jgi:ABC-type Fe3+-hydroxamate transport system substrate-binding protein
MALFTDQTGYSIDLEIPPKKIISLVPSQTELLYTLGLEEKVIGITKFCIHPLHWFKSKNKIGGTKNLHTEKITDMQPHLVLANKEENTKEQIELLQRHFPTWTSDISTLEDALTMIMEIGRLVNKAKEAATLAGEIIKRFNEFTAPTHQKNWRVAYLIWQNPYMTIGGDTFIHDMLERSGFQNIFGDKKRYPVVTPQEIISLQCELLLLSSEPYPFREKHVKVWEQYLPSANVLLVDGEAFSWYGSRLLHSPSYFQQLHRQIEAIT